VKLIKKIIYGFLILLLLVVLWYHEIVWYGLNQGYGQMRIVWNAEPIDELLKKPEVSDSVKRKLELIQEIKQFAFDSLGINESDNYSTFYDQKGKPALWVVTACEPFELKPYKWKFPFLGSFPYKGFFDRNKALHEEKEIRQKGLDTDIGTVSGWSTLGWFKDPVLSSMLRRSDGRLANLIIHELTHGTLYIKDSVDYNENLASFIGDKGAVKFLNYKYGPNSSQLQGYLDMETDDILYTEHVLAGAEFLEKRYKEMNDLTDVNAKKKLKAQSIDSIFKAMDTVSFKRYKPDYRYLNSDSINNTFFMGFKRYSSKQDYFEQELNTKFQGNLKKYMEYLKKKYPSL
jgi:predicted aminopeptidase